MSTPKRVWITEAADAAVRKAAVESDPLETGGLLLGVQRDGEPWITAAVEVLDPYRSGSRFEIPAGVTPALVDHVRGRDGRLGYLGDWHSHPLDLPASPTDLQTLARDDRRRRRRHGPALQLLVRATVAGWRLEAVSSRGKRARALPLLLTGPLPASENPA